MRSAACALLLGIVAVGCGSAPKAPPFKPIADTKLLMQTIVDPNADIIWDSVKTIITLQGTDEIRPKTDEQWTAVRNVAVAITEAGNLLMMAPRAKDSDEWMRASRAMIETGQAALQAVEKKNADELFTVGGEIYGACTNCHAKYMNAIVNASSND